MAQRSALGSVPDGRGRDVVGVWLASSARGGAAFASIGIELRRFGAPTELVERAEAALRDEARHARVLGLLAARRGARPDRPSVVETPVRTLVAFAIENAVEGCVREPWAALVAHWQGLHAADPEIAAAYARIAVDASRHAELAADIDRWVHGQLGPRDREAVRAARRAAVQSLAGMTEPDPELVRIAGLPSASTARRLLRCLTTEVWAHAA